MEFAASHEPSLLRSPEQLLPGDAPDDLRRCLAYWIAKAGDRAMPSFSDIDPVEIPWALSRVYVVRVVDGGTDFYYRLVGEMVRERHGVAMAGKRPGDLFPPGPTRHILERWRRLVNEPAACYNETEHPTRAGWRMRARRIQLPLGPPGGPVDNLLGMTMFEEPQMVPGTIGESGLLDIRWLRLRAV